MANVLVDFPTPGDEWENVDDGPGMYVLAVIPRGIDVDSCAIGAGISLVRPRGRLLTSVSPLWMEGRDSDSSLIEEAAQLFEEKGQRVKAALMRAQLPISDLSIEMIQATQMGSSSLTLKNAKDGEYWQADWKDLTPAGTLHLHQVHTCFMKPPLLLTFLGDEDV